MHGPRRSLLGLGLGLVLAACGPGGPSPGAETRTEAEAGDELGESGAGEEAGESESGETGEAESCGDLWIVPAYVPPLLMLVVDESESMLAPWDHDGDPETPTQPRWHGARAVVELLGEIAGDKAVVGLRAFPGADACPEATAMSPSCADASACSIAAESELALAEGNGPALLDAVPGLDPDPTLFAGASPAAAATEAAVDELVELRAARYPESPAFLFLITDGRSNCGAGLDAPESFAVHDQALLEIVAAARAEQGIVTAVIAVDEHADPELDLGADTIPGFDPLASLEALALAGGIESGGDNPPYFSAADLDRVAAAFEGPDELSSCVVDLSWTDEGPPSPEQIPLVSWEFEGQPLPRVELDACESSEGWAWIEEGTVLTFCGQTCEDFKAGAGEFHGIYGCP